MPLKRYQQAYTFHKRFFHNPQPTPLIRLENLEKEIGIKALYLKDESNRYGLPAFKILGASWGLVWALSRRTGVNIDDIDGMKEVVKRDRIGVHAATDGNHGRAVAHTATKLGMKSTIYVPRTVENWSIEAIKNEGEGCQVVRLDKDYDETVLFAASEAERLGDLLVQDTAWEGYEEIPKRIVEGYTHLFAEIEDQLPSNITPTHTIVPVGVGSLAFAAALSYQNTSTSLVTVEPSTAACLHESIKAGKRVTVKTSSTIMPGLNCGTVSSDAWPLLFRTIRNLDHSVVIEDEETLEAMKLLEDERGVGGGDVGGGIKVGPCGAAPLAALKHLKLDNESVVILICTEGAQ